MPCSTHAPPPVRWLYVFVVTVTITGTSITKNKAPKSTVPNRRREIVVRSDGLRTRKGREARTHWQVIKRFQHFTLAEFRLETGRTHQIRVHLSSIGYPLLGDPLYGGRKRLASIESPLLKKDLQKLHRQALHAASLGFVHPVSGNLIEFVSPIPDDLKETLESLEKFD